MIRRLSLPWPSEALRDARGSQPIRLLAVSDEQDRAFDFEEKSSLEPMTAPLEALTLKYQSPLFAWRTSKLALSAPFARTESTPFSADASVV